MDHNRVLVALDDVLDAAEGLLQKLGRIGVGRTDQIPRRGRRRECS